MVQGIINTKNAFFAVFTLERLWWAILYYVIAQGALMAFIKFQVDILGNDVVLGSKQSAKK
jgi:hypothetical protein